MNYPSRSQRLIETLVGDNERLYRDNVYFNRWVQEAVGNLERQYELVESMSRMADLALNAECARRATQPTIYVIPAIDVSAADFGDMEARLRAVNPPRPATPSS